MLLSLAEGARQLLELVLGLLDFVFRLLFGDPRPVVAGPGVHPLDPDRRHP